MLRKILNKFKKNNTTPVVKQQYTHESVKKLVNDAYAIGYNDGRRDGLDIARKSAIKTMKEILWQQNKSK